MQKSLFEENEIENLESVDGEEDLKPKDGINISPPPADGRCEGCGRHLSELKSFGKARDPLVGDFDGALLLKNFRWDAPPEENDKIMNEFFRGCSSREDFDKVNEKLIEIYGQEVAEWMIFSFSHRLSRQVGSC